MFNLQGAIATKELILGGSPQPLPPFSEGPHHVERHP